MTINLRNAHPRPRIQRAFLDWFRENRSRFAVAVRILRRTDKEIVLAFANVDPSLVTAEIAKDRVTVTAW